MRGPAAFKKTHVTRGLRAVLAAGLNVARVDINRDGCIAIFPGTPVEGGDEASNPWDEVLTNAADKERAT
jgi:hypothetical protein